MTFRLLPILLRHPNQRTIHLFRMTETQEMLSPFHNLQSRIRTVDKHFNFLLSIRDGIDRIARPMQPQYRTLHVRKSGVQTITFCEVDGCHSDSSATFVALVVLFDSFAPEIPCVFGAIFTETDVDEEIAVISRGFEVRGRFIGRPGGDVVFEEGGTVPASQGDGVGIFVVEGGA